MSEPFIAEIRIFGGNFAIRSWAFCHGQLLPVAQNTALFSLVGTTYGGDGRTTFGLPDLQSRLPMGTGRGPGLTSRRDGQRGGANTHTLSEGEMTSHDHPLKVTSADATTGTPSASNTLSKASANVYGPATDLEDMGQPVGGGQSHANEQPYLGLNFIIALQGLYPSRS